MSIYIQEVLGLLKRNKKKIVLDKVKDHFEFGKLFQNSSLNNAGTYGPRMEPFVIKWGDLVCQATENLTRTQIGSGVNGKVPVYTTPEGTCSWDTLKDSIISQNAIGDTISIAGNLIVNGTATVTSLTDNRVVIVGPGGLLEDDANFTMDGVTMTANVNVVHGTDVPAGTPAQTTRINSNLKLEGPVYDSLGIIGGLNKVLVGLADGRVKWQDDDVVEALTYGSLWQGDATNYKVELAIGTADQILISDGTTFAWQDNPSVKLPDVLCTVFRVPLWAPDNKTIGCSLLIQDGDGIGTAATEVKNDGKLHQVGDVRLDTVVQDDTLSQVLVRDPGAANLVKFRDAASLIPARGFDTLTMTANGGAAGKWTQTFLNAYIALDLSKFAFINIKGMTTLTDGEHGVVIAENTQSGTILPDNVIRFPDGWGTVGNLFDNRVTWTPGTDNGYPTSSLLFGETLKLSYINYDIPGGNNMLYWDACCKTQAAGNACPVAGNSTVTIDEDQAFSATVTSSDDGYGGYGLTFAIVTDIPSGEGSVVLNPTTGNWVYTPTANYFGTTSFTFTVFDGYCTSNVGTVTIIVRAVADPPIWTSTDPTTLNTYPNLTGNQTWTYNWTVADGDDPCGSLTFPSQTIPSWLTFTNNGDCTGTLTGTYPNVGGDYNVVLNVQDPAGNADTQAFVIGGLGVTINTYFQFWSDTSGSMNTTIQKTAQMVSLPVVVSKATTSGGSGSGSSTIRFGGNPGGQVGSGRVSDASGTTTKSYLCVKVGSVVTGAGVPANCVVSATTEISSQTSEIELADATSGAPVNHTVGSGGTVTFTATDAMMTADYNDPNSFRKLLQDFYQTGGTQGSGNLDPTSNGRDQYNSHIYWSHQNEERQIRFFSGGLNGTPADGTNYNTIWPSADTIVNLCFADESSNYKMGSGESGNGTWSDRANSTVTTITDDVTQVKSFISNIVAAAGNNTIYRGIFFPVKFSGSSPNAQVNGILAGDGLMATGGLTANGFAYAPQAGAPAGAYNVTTQTLYPESSGAPKYLTYRGTTGNALSDGGLQSYYYGQVLAALNDIGYSLV